MCVYSNYYILFNYVAILACSLFINSKQFKFRFKNDSYISILVIILSCLFVFLSIFLRQNMFFQEVILVITCTILFKCGFWHLLYSNLILIQIAILIDILLMIALLLTNTSTASLSIFVLVVVRNGLLALITILGYKLSLKKYISAGIESYRNENILILACLFIFLLHSYSLYNFSNLDVFGFMYPTYDLIHSFIVNLLFIIMTFLNIVFINTILRNKYLEYDNKLYQKSIDLQFENYKLLEKYLLDTKTLVHDHKQHLLVIKMLIDKGEIDRLKTYVAGLSEDFAKVKRIKSCENLILDAIIQSKIPECKHNNIKYTYDVNVPPNMNIKDSDLVIVFGNLLTNAIEACLKIKNKDVEKYIHITVNMINGILVANIENSKKNKVRIQDNLFQTTKKDSTNHGIGLSSVSNVINRYNGNILFSFDSNKFEVKFMMHL